MSCEHDAPVKFEVYMDRTLACNPLCTHDNSDEATSDCFIQMEHSYSRDTRPSDKTMASRTLLVHKPPPCPSCHNTNNASNMQSHDEPEIDMDMPDDDEESISLPNNISVTPESREAMDVIANIAAKTKNRNLEEDDWEELVDKLGWTVYQHTLFAKVADILNSERLARLTYMNHPHEPALRRTSIDKAVQRMRKAFAVIHWDLKLTQWLHGLLIDHLPISYTTAYMDILQTLRDKVPTLVDKMFQGKSTDLVEAVLKPPWEPVLEVKERKIPQEPVFIVVPSCLHATDPATETHWMPLLSTISPHVHRVEIPEIYTTNTRATLGNYLERLVTLSRTKIHDVRKLYPQKPIVLLGCNVGAALAIQVATLEMNINCVICLGFATNTMKGVRGTLDDRLVDLTTPTLFIIGQNAARTSQEGIEAVRETMVAPTALVVIGSADDSLRVNHVKRKLEKVTQGMVDNMIMDEVREFVNSCITNPPSPVKKRAKPPPPPQPTPTTVINSSGEAGTIVIVDSPVKGKLNGGGGAGGLVTARKPRSPVKMGRVNKRSREGAVVTKMSPPKKEFAEKIALTTQGGTTSYEIVTGKIKQDLSVRQVVDGGFIQIANSGGDQASVVNNTNNKWGVAGRPMNPLMLPLVQTQKISLGSQFTPMRTPASIGGVLPKNSSVYTVNARGKKIYSVQTAEVTETIELDSEEEIINLDGDQVVVDPSSLITETVEMEEVVGGVGDLSSVPVVFQDSDGNIQETPALQNVVQETILIADGGSQTGASGSVVVSSGSQMIPRPNKFIYYKPHQIIAKGTAAGVVSSQYVVLGNMDDQRCVTTIAGTGQTTVLNSGKPLIISVESLEKGAPNTVYHVVDDMVEK